MLFLPNTPGDYPVGGSTFAAPARPTRIIGSVQRILPKTKTGHAQDLEPALKLEEVAFTAYYPADIASEKRKKGLDWLLRWARNFLNGRVEASHTNHLHEALFEIHFMDSSISRVCVSFEFRTSNTPITDLRVPGFPPWVIWPALYFFGIFLKVCTSLFCKERYLIDSGQ